jgi:hypothetical protein
MRTLLALAVAAGLTAAGLAQTTPAPGETASQFYLRCVEGVRSRGVEMRAA